MYIITILSLIYTYIHDLHSSLLNIYYHGYSLIYTSTWKYMDIHTYIQCVLNLEQCIHSYIHVFKFADITTMISRHLNGKFIAMSTIEEAWRWLVIDFVTIFYPTKMPVSQKKKSGKMKGKLHYINTIINS